MKKKKIQILKKVRQISKKYFECANYIHFLPETIHDIHDQSKLSSQNYIH